MKKNILYACSRRLLLAAAVMSVGTGAVFAQAPAPELRKGWETTAAAGVTLTRGNSDTFLATLSLDTVRKWERDEVMLGTAGAYGDNNSVANQKSLLGYGQYNHLFSERFYGGIRVDGLYDGIANLDYRFKVSPLLGYYLVKTPRTRLAFEAGPSMVFEKYASSSATTYCGVRLAERFEHKLTDTTKVWESCEYLARVDKWADNYLVNTEVGIDAAVTKHWSLRVVFQDFFNNAPAAGRKQNDLRLLAGTAYKF